MKLIVINEQRIVDLLVVLIDQTLDLGGNRNVNVLARHFRIMGTTIRRRHL